MIQLSIRRLVPIVIIAILSFTSQAQPAGDVINENKKLSKPYKILTSGKQVTLKSTKEIKSIMVWAASGHRIVEQKDLNVSSYSFRISVNEKVFFVMIKLADGKRYTDKIGVQ